MKKLNMKVLLAAAVVTAALSGDAVIVVAAAVRAPAPAVIAPAKRVLPVSLLVRKPSPLLMKLGAPSRPLVSKASLGVKSSGEIAMAVPSMAVRPPYRPPPRSPYRPPARPPFGP